MSIKYDNLPKSNTIRLNSYFVHLLRISKYKQANTLNQNG